MHCNSRCFIVGAGDFYGKINKNENDLIIAADGGMKHLDSLSVSPDIIIGDFDSLGFVPNGENVIKLPVKKDVTDTFAAVDIAEKKGYKTVILLGCTGGERSDHFIANLQTLLYAASKKINAYMIGNNEVFTALDNAKIIFKERKKGFISVFPFEKSSVVSIKGLLYETEKKILTSKTTLGISNEFTGKESYIKAEDGAVIVFWQGSLTDVGSPAYEV